MFWQILEFCLKYSGWFNVRIRPFRGINMVGQRLGDPPGGLNLRLHPPNPQFMVSPWLTAASPWWNQEDAA